MIFIVDINQWHKTLGDLRSPLFKWLNREKYKTHAIQAHSTKGVDVFVKLVDGKSPAQMISMMESSGYALVK